MPVRGSWRRIAGVALVLAAAATVTGARAQDGSRKDIPGGRDSPYISRFAGSALVGYEERSFDETRLPLTNEVVDKRYVKAQSVEGRITRLVYLAPIGKTRLEVQRNYQDALTRAGFVKKFACDGDACGTSARIQEPLIGYASTMKQLASYGGYSEIAFIALNTSNDPHYIWGVLKSGGREITVSIFLSVVDAVDGSPLKNRVGTFIEVVEPRAMETGQVVVDANALQKGLAADGKIALYGVYFDTGRAEVRPESKAQLDQMAKLLDGDRSLKVFVVGHTDDQGTVDGNLQLSQRRADALVAALVRDYHVDPKRLMAKGVASFAPVATNDNETGRARNRRVELVKQ